MAMYVLFFQILWLHSPGVLATGETGSNIDRGDSKTGHHWGCSLTAIYFYHPGLLCSKSGGERQNISLLRKRA